MDTTTKLVGNDCAQFHQVYTKLELFLTKRSNGLVSMIAWEPLQAEMPQTEMRIFKGYCKHTKIIQPLTKPYTPDDEGWGIN